MRNLRSLNSANHIKPDSCPGFALLDSLIAMSLLAAGFISLVGLQGKLLDSHGNNQTLGEAMVLVESKLEYLRYLTRKNMRKTTLTDDREIRSGSSVKFDLQWSNSERAGSRYYIANASTSWQRGSYKRTLTLEGTAAVLEPMPERLLRVSGRREPN